MAEGGNEKGVYFKICTYLLPAGGGGRDRGV